MCPPSRWQSGHQIFELCYRISLRKLKSSRIWKAKRNGQKTRDTAPVKGEYDQNFKRLFLFSIWNIYVRHICACSFWLYILKDQSFLPSLNFKKCRLEKLLEQRENFFSFNYFVIAYLFFIKIVPWKSIHP